MKWRRAARVVLALAAVAFALVVATSMRQRQAPRTPPPVPRADPQAVIESQGGTTVRVKGEREDFNLTYERLLTYANGASRMVGVTIVTERSGRTYTVKGGEGQAGENETSMELSGGVRLEATDGMVVRADRATFSQAEGMVRIPGAAQFSRDRMSGSGFGFDYDQRQDIVRIGDRAAITVAAGKDGVGAMTIEAGGLEFHRTEKVVRLDRGARIAHDGQLVEAEQGLAHLTPDEQRLELLELRGNARITSTSAPRAGGLEALRGRDIDLRYAQDGQSLERAVITGDADLQIAGDRRQAGRRITAVTMTIDLAADGTTPVALTARDNVRVTLPAEGGGASRTIQAQTLDSDGTPEQGLTGARFTGSVQYAEQRQGGGRSARSQTLDVTMAPGFGAIEDARFARGVRFADGDLFATAALGRYGVGGGTLELSGSEPGSTTPHVVNDRMSVDATRIDITFEGPVLNAAGAVKSVLSPRRGTDAKADAARLPSMLKDDQPVNVTANTLAYDGGAERAAYTGNALLWQGETSIKGAAITIDSRTGDLAAAGPVTTSTLLLQEDKDGRKQKVSSIGTAKDFAYVDAVRRATYTGDAHITGPQGDLTSPRVELFLKESGDELDRAEAYDGVTLRGDGRKTDGVRLTFFGADQRYVVTGAPVKIIDECGRETTGRTLTFFRATDRIVVDGAEQIRTQTRGKSNCP